MGWGGGDGSRAAHPPQDYRSCPWPRRPCAASPATAALERSARAQVARASEVRTRTRRGRAGEGFFAVAGGSTRRVGRAGGGAGGGRRVFSKLSSPGAIVPPGPKPFSEELSQLSQGESSVGSGIARSGPEEGPGEAGGGVRRTLSGLKARGPGSFPQISARARPSPPVCHPPETLSTVLAAPCTAVGGRGGGRHNQNLSPPACQAPPPHCPGLHPPAPACIGTRTTPATTGTGTGRPARQPGRRQRQRQRGRPSRARRAPRPRPTARSRPSSRTSCCPRRPAKRSVLRHRPPQQEEEGEDRPSTWLWRSSASRAARGSWGRS